MSGHTVYIPKTKHECNPAAHLGTVRVRVPRTPWVLAPGVTDDQRRELEAEPDEYADVERRPAIGEVWECECGKTWVAVDRRAWGHMMPGWRREGWREKRKRLKHGAA